MVQEGCEALLGYAEVPETRRRTCVPSRRAFACVSVTGSVLVAAVVSYTLMATWKSRNGFVLRPTRWSASSIVSHAFSRSKTRIETSNASNVVAPTELMWSGSPSCLKFTGGTCNVQKCFSWRHAACERSGLIHHCNCQEGCVRADFSCHSGENRLVRQGFHLTNGHWPSSYLYVPLSKFLKTLRVGDMGMGDNRFILFEVPGVIDGFKKYTMSSIHFPDKHISMDPSSTPGALFEVNDVMSDNPKYLLWTICRPRGHTGPYVQMGIGGPETGFVWAYVHRWSYIVYGWPQHLWGPPDSKAQWKPSIPLGTTIDACPA